MSYYENRISQQDPRNIFSGDPTKNEPPIDLTTEVNIPVLLRMAETVNVTLRQQDTQGDN